MKPKPKCGLRGLIQKGGNGVRFDLGKTPSVAWCRQEDGGNDRGLLLGRDGELGRSMLGCVVGKEKNGSGSTWASHGKGKSWPGWAGSRGF
jgi:hypothetical protein